MNYRRLGNTGVKVSPLCLGTMMFGGQADETESNRIMSRALDLGINFFDTANMYNAGQSEVVVGKFVKQHRDKIVLATKGRQKMGEGPNDKGASRLHLTREVENSLRRLGTDRIDLYYVHQPDAETPIEETLRALDDLIRQGKILYLACSNFRAWQLAEALWTSDKLNLNRFVCVQPLYNLVNRDIEVELLPLCESQKLGVVTYSPLARGILTGKYAVGQAPPEGSRAARNDARMKQAEWRDASLEVAAQVAAHSRTKGVTPSQFGVAWCLANRNVTSVILGPRTLDQFEDNVGALKVAYTADDEKFVDSLVPVGEHSGKGFQDSAYPITGRAV